MSSSFQSRIKSIVAAFLALTICLAANSQEEKLQPELTIASGLSSNGVRCITIDSQGRPWVGTDNGLNILSGITYGSSSITEYIGNKSIWAIAFLDSLAFIGSRYDGLYIFNRFTGHLYKHHEPPEINNIRKIKIFDGELFILTNDGPYKWTMSSLKKITLAASSKSDFIIDMFNWGSDVFGLAYPSSQIVKYSSDVFWENANSLFLGQDVNYNSRHFYCAMPYKGKVILGSESPNPLITVIEKGRPPISYDMVKSLPYGYVVWDMKVIKDKILLAVGDINTNSNGFLQVLTLADPNSAIKVKDYLTCLGVDSTNNSLYFGTLNKGLFLQTAITGTKIIDKPLESSLVANTKNVFLHTPSFIWKVNQNNFPNLGIRNNIFNIKDSTSTIELTGDTIISADDKYINLYDAVSLKLLRKIPKVNGPISIGYVSSIKVIKNTMFLFDNYTRINKYDVETNKAELLRNMESFIPYPQVFGDKIILLNKEKGFNVITETNAYQLSCDDKNIPFVDDFTLIHDTLCTLSRNNLKLFQISYHTHRLIFIRSFAIDSLVEGFVPKWLLSKDNQLYLCNDNGILRFNPIAGRPNNYFYFGNYFKLSKPIVAGDSLLIASENILSKISFSEIDHPAPDNMEHGDLISSPETVNENLDFKITITSSEYLSQNHGLKSLDILHNGKLVSTKYSITREFTFINGLKYGDYELSLNIGKFLTRKDINITLPLNRNPYFFGFLSLLTVIILIISIKAKIDKAQLTKKLAQNQLRALKQNLNPHFIYNSLNLISSLILEEKYDDAVQVVSEFSALQRTYLETNNKESISLEEELKFLSAYLRLQQRRFSHDNDFSYSIDIAEKVNINSVSLPPLILQPIAENAIKYGIIGSSASTKWIRIQVKGTDPVIISIEDNGSNITQSKKELGMGHSLVLERIILFNSNSKQRIKIFFNKPVIDSPSGYRVEIHIPNENRLG